MEFKSVSKAIKSRRTQLGMTQEELAKRSGLTRQMIERIENGKGRSTRMSTLESIANGLGLSLYGLLILAVKEEEK